MLIRLFTLGFDPVTERFNDESVRDFLADKAVEAVRDHFFVQDGRAYLTLVVCYRLAGPAGPAGPAVSAAAGAGDARQRQREEAWRALVEQANWPLFNTLRDWRGERARAAGIPSYVICNNRQLADVVNKRPATLAELGQIDGFGDAKLKNYGREILEIIARAGAAPPEADHAGQ